MGLKLENDNHSGFDDSNYVTIDEEKKLKKRFTIIMIVALVLGTLIFIDILIVNYTSVGPFLAIKVKTHNDGGTKEYYGLGYKVIKYKVKDGRNTTVIGGWTLKYNPTPKTTTVEELGISFRNNTKEALKDSYKQFFIVTGVIDSIDKTNKKIVLIYEDASGGNYTTKVEFYLKDVSKLKKYNKNDIITINGTFMKYTPKSNNVARTITFNNCTIVK